MEGLVILLLCPVLVPVAIAMFLGVLVATIILTLLSLVFIKSVFIANKKESNNATA